MTFVLKFNIILFFTKYLLENVFDKYIGFQILPATVPSLPSTLQGIKDFLVLGLVIYSLDFWGLQVMF